MNNTHDPQECARDILDDAAQALGVRRGYRGPFLDDPAVRLHLLARLHHQLQTKLLGAILDAYEHAYNADELAELLDYR